MPKLNLILTDFTGGEVTPLLSGRTKAQFYARSCRTLKNFVVLPQGPITRRSGFRHAGKTIDSIDGADSARAAVGIPYSLDSQSAAYSLIFQEDDPVAGGAYTLTFTDQGAVQVSRGKQVTATASGGTPFATGNSVVNRVIEATGTFTGKFLITERVSDTVVIGDIIQRVKDSGTPVKVITANNWRINKSFFEVYKSNSDGTMSKVAITGTYIYVPYASTDFAKIKYRQMGSLLELTHPSYPTCKIIATSETVWTFFKIKFLPPPLMELPFYMPGGTGIEFITTAVTTGGTPCQNGNDRFARIAATDAFVHGDKGRRIRAGTGMAIIQRKNASSTNRLADIDIIQPFDKSTYAAGEWWLEGSPGGLMNVKGYSGASTTADLTQVQKKNNYLTFGVGDTTCFRGASGSLSKYTPDGDLGNYIRTQNQIAVIVALVDATKARGYSLTPYAKDSAYIDAKKESEGWKWPTTYDWQLLTEVFNTDYGYPSCIAYYEQRVFLAGHPYYMFDLWGSRQGDIENYAETDKSDSALHWSVFGDSARRIQWMHSGVTMFIGTTGGELMLSSMNMKGAPLTPSNFNFVSISSYGSADIDAVRMGDSTFFVQQGGKAIIEIVLDPQGTVPVVSDRSMLAPHLFTTAVAGLVGADRPLPTLWAYNTSGVLRGLTYMPDEKIYAWHQHTQAYYNTTTQTAGDGKIESMWTLPNYNNGATEVWAIVKRYVKDGANNWRYWRYIERMDTITTATDYADMLYSDCGITWSGGASGTLTGLTHLKGRVINVLYSTGSTVAAVRGITGTGSITAFASGGTGVTTATCAAHGLSNGDVIVITGNASYNGTYAVSGVTTNTFNFTKAFVATGTASWTGAIVDNSGQFVLPDGATCTKAQVGLPFTSVVIPNRLEVEVQGQTVQMGDNRIVNVGLRVNRSGPLKIGTSESNIYPITYITGTAWTTAEDEKDFPINFPGGYDPDGTAAIVSDGPWPATLVCVTAEVEVNL